MIKIIIAVGLLTAAISIMYSCKKDQDPDFQTNNPVTENKISETESQIVSFLETIKKYKNGEKSNETMSLEEAVLLWENTLNYCHSFTSTPIDDFNFDTIYLKVNGVNNGVISTNDAVEMYNSIIDNVRNVYSNIMINNKKLHYVMIDDFDLSKNEDVVQLVVITGRETPPFEDNDTTEPEPWYGFRIFPSLDCKIADDTLTAEICKYDMEHWNWSYFVPCPNCYTYVHSYNIEYTYSYKNCDWVYYGHRDSIISSSDMYVLYKNIMLNTHTEDMVTNPYYEYGYYETIVKDFEHFNNDTISHIVYVAYAVREWRERHWDEEEYPEDIDPSN